MFKLYYILCLPLTGLCLLAIKVYQLTISRALGKNCHSIPTCSAYAFEAVKVYGAIWGGVLAIKRLARCHKIKGEVDLLEPNLLGNYKWKC